MNQFLDDLHFFCTEHLAPPKDAEYRSGMEALCGMEAQIERALGENFFRRYDERSYQMRQWEVLESFRAGLRFGADFTGEVWGQSSQVASPSRLQADFTSPQEKPRRKRASVRRFFSFSSGKRPRSLLSKKRSTASALSGRVSRASSHSSRGTPFS